MKGGPSVRVLLDLALGDEASTAREAAEVLKTQVSYEADMGRTQRPTRREMKSPRMFWKVMPGRVFYRSPNEEEIQVVTYVAAEGDISTDLLSPGKRPTSGPGTHGNA